MDFQLDIVFLHFEPSDLLKAFTYAKAARMDRFRNHIVHCRVVVDIPHHHHSKGNECLVLVEILVPGGMLVVRQAGVKVHTDEDLCRAIGVALNKAYVKLRVFSETRIRHHKARTRSYRRHMRRIDPASFNDDLDRVERMTGSPEAFPA